MTEGPIMSRRKVLIAAGGLAGLAGVGYVFTRRPARKEVINVRIVSGEDIDGRTVVGG